MSIHTSVATLHTNHGAIKINLFGNHAPKTVANFEGLATGSIEWKDPRSGAAQVGKPLYNVGRRNNQWMLQHAISAARQLGEDAEITLLALWDERSNGEIGVGGISDLTRKAAMQGIKVVHVRIPTAAADSLPKGVSPLVALADSEARSTPLAASAG